jgi:hypothetical protein
MWLLVDDVRHFVQEVEVAPLEALLLSLAIGYALTKGITYACTCAFVPFFI